MQHKDNETGEQTLSKGSIADILIEALPYIRRFAGMTVVIKYGGHAMVDAQLKEDFARDITLLKFVGLHPVVVHGGGPQINSVLDQMGIQPRFVRGMRLTDGPTMDVVEMVLGGKAVGLSGKDGNLIQARKMQIVFQEDATKPPEIIDPGMVGQVTRINPAIIHALTRDGFLPVIAPVGVGDNGETYNINADLVASQMAVALNAGRLIMMTDVDGVMDAQKQLISTIAAATIEQMIAHQQITGGMIPKIECALEALRGGVEKVPIINGKRRHAILLELFTDEGIGTEVTL